MSFLTKPIFLSKALPPRVSLTDQLEAALLRAKRILLVDDDERLCALVRKIAREYEVDVLCAERSLEAKTMIDSDDRFDSVILDVGVLNGDGIELYRWIQREHPRLAVTFLTGNPIDAVADKIHAVGSAPVYSKLTCMSVSFMEDFFEKLGARRRAQA